MVLIGWLMAEASGAGWANECSRRRMPPTAKSALLPAYLSIVEGREIVCFGN